jgi:hypothetical protein
MMNICTGDRLRQELDRLSVALTPLEVVTGVPKWKTSVFLQGGRLTSDEITRIERALTAIDRIQSAIFPARLDCRDGIALRAAIEALHAGRFGDVERMAVPPPENPDVITL